MTKQLAYQIMADFLLFAHAFFIAFVVFGLLLIFLGLLLRWSWVRKLWFRLTHLLAIVIVVIQAWLGVICPLTIWENHFRMKAGDAVYSGSFISFWLHKLIFYQAEAWVFTAIYTAFGSLVLAAWVVCPPRLRRTNLFT
jgi:polyferredoxin